MVELEVIPIIPHRLNRWTAPSYALLSTQEISVLPVVDDRAARAGVYFLMRGCRGSASLVYVGVSDNVALRVRTHRRRKMDFALATYAAIDWPWHLSVEALYIDRYAPLYNVRRRSR